MTTPVSVLLGSLEETIPLSERIAVAALQQNSAGSAAAIRAAHESALFDGVFTQAVAALPDAVSPSLGAAPTFSANTLLADALVASVLGSHSTSSTGSTDNGTPTVPQEDFQSALEAIHAQLLEDTSIYSLSQAADQFQTALSNLIDQVSTGEISPATLGEVRAVLRKAVAAPAQAGVPSLGDAGMALNAQGLLSIDPLSFRQAATDQGIGWAGQLADLVARLKATSDAALDRQAQSRANATQQARDFLIGSYYAAQAAAAVGPSQLRPQRLTSEPDPIETSYTDYR